MVTIYFQDDTDDTVDDSWWDEDQDGWEDIEVDDDDES